MKRVYVNIAAFVVLTGGAIVWSTLNFLHLEFIERPDIVTVEFEQSPGLRSGYEVTYLGHSVGRVRGVELVPGMSEVEVAIDRGHTLPADVVAAARRRSAIGEPYVDLSPAPGTDADEGPRLADGDRIVLANTSSPLQYGDLFRSLDTLIERIDAETLASVTDELATAVDGRGDDLRRIVQGSEDLTTSLAENGDELEQLIDGVAEITRVLADNRDSLGSGIDSLAGLTTALEAARPSIETLVDEGPSAVALLNRIIDASDHALICTFDGTQVLDVVLDAETLQSLTGILHGSAAFADVIELVQDERDGIFRLFVSPSGGNPPTVEYAEPAPYPLVPGRLSCPEHDVSVTAAEVVDEAGAASGGTRPPRDSVGGPSDRPDGEAADLASGASDEEAGDSALERLFGAIADTLPFAVAAGAIGLLLFLLIRRRRQA